MGLNYVNLAYPFRVDLEMIFSISIIGASLF